MSDNPHKLKLAWYGFVVFLSSAILLVLEITAGRLIAPYVGVTLYSWTSIIGIVLAGLSLGNWIGGRWADRGADERSTGIALAMAAVFSLASLLTLTLLAPLLQASELDLVSASFVYVLCLFFVPSLLLGIPTPLLTTLALKLDLRIGHVVGRMHALAALGSIAGTFVTGFVLIQYLGTRSIIVISSVILFVLALPFSDTRHALCRCSSSPPVSPSPLPSNTATVSPVPATARAITFACASSTRRSKHLSGGRMRWCWITCCTGSTTKQSRQC